MLRFKLRELVAEKTYKAGGRRLTFEEVSKTTGINRSTLSKMANIVGYNTTTDNVDKLCEYFDCEISDLVEYLPAGSKEEGES